jgi:hypothetical protein
LDGLSQIQRVVVAAPSAVDVVAAPNAPGSHSQGAGLASKLPANSGSEDPLTWCKPVGHRMRIVTSKVIRLGSRLSFSRSWWGKDPDYMDLLALAFVPFQLYVFTSALAGIFQEQCISSTAVRRDCLRVACSYLLWLRTPL